MVGIRDIQERMWGPFPALRKALEGRNIPDSYYGPTSVSDNMFDELVRLAKMAVLVREYEGEVKHLLQSSDTKAVYRDLTRLSEMLESVGNSFQQKARDVRALSSSRP